ncbi:MAG: hypothetical protein WC205_04190 [Opitutaceae bacterium]|jgi:hypothetical protein
MKTFDEMVDEVQAKLAAEVSEDIGRRALNFCFQQGFGHETNQSNADCGDNVLTEEVLLDLLEKHGRKPFELSGEIKASEALVEQFRFPKSKKKRIRKKWAKRPGNWRPMKKVWVLEDGTIYAHPDHLIFRAEFWPTKHTK